MFFFLYFGVLLPTLSTQSSSFNVLFVDFCSLQAFPSTHSLPLTNVSSFHHFFTPISSTALPSTVGRLSTSSTVHLCGRWATDPGVRGGAEGGEGACPCQGVVAGTGGLGAGVFLGSRTTDVSKEGVWVESAMVLCVCS